MEIPQTIYNLLDDDYQNPIELEARFHVEYGVYVKMIRFAKRLNPSISVDTIENAFPRASERDVT